VAERVRGRVIEGCGRFVAEEKPQELLDALLERFAESANGMPNRATSASAGT
jgi:hypothetical protein